MADQRAGLTEDDIARLRLVYSGRVDVAAGVVLQLLDEVERLNLEVMAHQVGEGYEKGYEHGVLTAAKFCQDESCRVFRAKSEPLGPYTHRSRESE